jgi:hypothetical protein
MIRRVRMFFAPCYKGGGGGLDKKNEMRYNTAVTKTLPGQGRAKRKTSKLGVWNFLRWVFWLRLGHTSGNSKNWAQNQFDSRFRGFLIKTLNFNF